MSGVIIFFGEGQTKIYPVVISKEKSSTILKERVHPSKKVTPTDDFEKGNNIFNVMEEPVVTILINYLDKFQGRSSGLTGWMNLDHKWFKIR